MQNDIKPADIKNLLKIAGINGFNSEYEALGGGEVNDTYKIYAEGRQLILRISKDKGQDTLAAEAAALTKLDSSHVPKVIFFDPHNFIKGRAWILETYVSGITPTRLTLKQFFNLGKLLAEIHKVHDKRLKINLHEQFLDISKNFGHEQELLNHPDDNMRFLIHKAYTEFEKLHQFTILYKLH